MTEVRETAPRRYYDTHLALEGPVDAACQAARLLEFWWQGRIEHNEEPEAPLVLSSQECDVLTFAIWELQQRKAKCMQIMDETTGVGGQT